MTDGGQDSLSPSNSPTAKHWAERDLRKEYDQRTTKGPPTDVILNNLTKMNWTVRNNFDTSKTIWTKKKELQRCIWTELNWGDKSIRWVARISKLNTHLLLVWLGIWGVRRYIIIWLIAKSETTLVTHSPSGFWFTHDLQPQSFNNTEGYEEINKTVLCNSSLKWITEYCHFCLRWPWLQKVQG